ncbi:MAG: L,D-transpeptidase family protein [Acidobacteriota bacterium]
MASAAPWPKGHRPSSLLQVAPQSGPSPVIYVDKSRHRLHVFLATGRHFEHLRSLDCVTGKVAGDKEVEGDLKTPEGVYWFLARIPDEELPPLYGAGALTMDYPNVFDRHRGKTGYGIWLHGVETDDRVDLGRDTRGCVALRNDEYRWLTDLVELRETAIVIVPELEHESEARLDAKAEQLVELLRTWERSWESEDWETYEKLYHPDFRDRGLGLDAWMIRKKRLAALRGAISVELDRVSAFEEAGRVWLRFEQRYRGGDHEDEGVKTLHLLPGSDGSLRILGERWRADAAEVAASRIAQPLASAAPVSVAQPAPSSAPGSPFQVRLESEPAPVRSMAVPVRRPAVSKPPVPAVPPAAEVTEPVDSAPPEPLEAPVMALSEEFEQVPALPPRLVQQALELDRGIHQIVQHHVREDGNRLFLDFLIRDTRPHLRREARLWLEVPGADGPHRLPADAAFEAGEPLTPRQGQLVSLELPRRDGELREEVRLRMADARGRTSLEAVYVLTTEPSP